MSLCKSSPYLHDVYTIKQYGKYNVKISYCQALRERGWEDERNHKKKCFVNNEKLSNNLSRAKSTVRELGLCNDWDYFVTLTISSDKHNRYDLELYRKKLSEFIHNYNRRCPDEFKVKFLLVPEKHKDGAWHMHGLIKGIKQKDLLYNDNGYLDWKQYHDKFGYISLDLLREKDKATSYILKYITKETEKNVTELNAHLYYCSKGLNRATKLYCGKAEYNGDWDWEHPDGYCKVKNVDIRETDIDTLIKIRGGLNE